MTEKKGVRIRRKLLQIYRVGDRFTVEQAMCALKGTDGSRNIPSSSGLSQMFRRMKDNVRIVTDEDGNPVSPPSRNKQAKLYERYA